MRYPGLVTQISISVFRRVFGWRFVLEKNYPPDTPDMPPPFALYKRVCNKGGELLVMRDAKYWEPLPRDTNLCRYVGACEDTRLLLAYHRGYRKKSS